MLGHGPGSVAALWPAWEQGYWRLPHPDAERRFAAPQDHVHDDYLEWALTLGLAGALARVALLVAAIATVWAATDTRSVGVGCALVTLAARAVLDFPFFRPAELCLYGVLASMSLGESE